MVLVHLQVLIWGYALNLTTLRVVGITTRSVVKLSLPTQICHSPNKKRPRCTAPSSHHGPESSDPNLDCDRVPIRSNELIGRLYKSGEWKLA